MLPGDASQEERRNETQLRKRRPRRADGGAEAPERDPARDPPPARQDGSAPPSPELRGGRRRAAPLPTRAAAKVAAEAALRRCYSNGTAGAARSRCALPRPPSSAVRARGAAEGRGN